MVHADGGVASADGDDVGTLGMRMRKVFVRPRSDQDGMNVERRGDAGFLVLLMLTRGRADFSTSSLTIAIGTAGGPTGGQCLNSPLTYLPPSLLAASAAVRVGCFSFSFVLCGFLHPDPETRCLGALLRKRP